MVTIIITRPVITLVKLTCGGAAAAAASAAALSPNSAPHRHLDLRAGNVRNGSGQAERCKDAIPMGLRWMWGKLY